MIRNAPKKIFAALLLFVLLAAYAGHKVHIFNEDPAHFAAFCGDLVPDNGATGRIVERCEVDDYHFFPFLCNVQFVPAFFTAVVARPYPLATRCKAVGAILLESLRGPPVR